MGLCKCPKRRVTNQFCFEHRVNVCEHCMVFNHPKCIVQSYIQWLQDSDYNSVCELCNESLSNGDCIRLTCYHIYHWVCLEAAFRRLPRSTAPAGYQCPTCHMPLFPPPNLVSPVADVLRERLSSVNWARAGLGLSLLCDDTDFNSEGSVHSDSLVHNNLTAHYEMNGYLMNGSSPTASNFSTHSDSLGTSKSHRVTPIGASDDESNSRKSNGPPYSVIHVPDENVFDTSKFDNYAQTPRKIFEPNDPNRKINSCFDHDDNKYQRKSPTEMIVRWWKNWMPPSRNRRSAGYFTRRNIMSTIIMSLLIITLILILMKIGRGSVDDDSNVFKDNPNLHVQMDA